MPPLKVLGRRWSIGGDDLLVAAVAGFALHLIWVILFIAVLVAGVGSSGMCSPIVLIRVYVALNVAVGAAHLATDFAVAWTSLRGTVRHTFEGWAHRDVRFPMTPLETLAQSLGFYLIAGPSPLVCPNSPISAVAIKACVSLIFLSLVAWVVVVSILVLRSEPLGRAMSLSAKRRQEQWLRWFQFVCFGHRNTIVNRGDVSSVDGGEVLRDVARVFADFFADADTVASDVLVGLLYVGRKQYLERLRLRGVESGAGRETRSIASGRSADGDRTVAMNLSGGSPTGHACVSPSIGREPIRDLRAAATAAVKLSRHSPDETVMRNGAISSTETVPLEPGHQDRCGEFDGGIRAGVTKDELDEVAYFFQYAEAIYGLPLYVLSNFCVGLKLLLCPACCAPHLREQSVVDSVRTHLGRPGWPFCCVKERPPRNRHSDLIAISLDNGVFRSPYIVVLDHERRAVVVAIRGTMSTADVLVDLNCDLATLSLPSSHGEAPKSVLTHSGMLTTASRIRDEISGLLQGLLLDQQSAYFSYRLIVCGHSLGAGVSSLLTHLLRMQSLSAQCLAYSPPGCIATPDSAEHFASFVISVVLGDDVVPRLNRRTVHVLKRKVRAAVLGCRKRKVEVLGSFLFEALGLREITDTSDGEFWDEESVVQIDPEYEFGPVDEDHDEDSFATDATLARNPRFGQEFDDGHGVQLTPESVQMHVPGKIIHFVKERISGSDLGDSLNGEDDDGNSTSQSCFWRHRNRRPGRSLLQRASASWMKRGAARVLYRPVWAQPKDLSEIVISATMAPDHMPNTLGLILGRAMEAGALAANGVVPGISL